MQKFCLNIQNNEYLLQNSKHKNVQRISSSYVYSKCAIILMTWCPWLLLSILNQFGATSFLNAPQIRSSSVPLRRQVYFPVLISINYQSTKFFFGQGDGLILYKNFERSDFEVLAKAIEGTYLEFSVFYTASRSLMA